ncbi:cell division protein FtsA [Sporomusa termitida]|uniref:Cell division protein FtsA n=1 Tax=Sporomusa termitida TaxID=2377 RepID=A0A517DSR3_9FIRM|nr:cell division protein FtsA [Sporomusa termitida]QDR80392.1 Cell division protein FtsA [Sporomusa termitida]
MDKKNILAIDVGTGMVKVLAGRQEANGRIQLFGSGAAPTAGFAKGVITDIDALAHSIRQAVECVVLATDSRAAGSVYLGLSGSVLVTQTSIGTVAAATAGVVTGADVERACQAAVFSVADHEYEVLHVFPAREDVTQAGAALAVETHIISAPKATLAELSRVLSRSGIQLNGIVASGIIAAEGMNTELPGQPTNFIFIDIGAGVADISLYVKGRLRSSAALPLGGDYITSDLMQGLSVNRAHAEEIKRYYSRLSPDLRNQGVVLDCNDYGTVDKHIPFDFLYDIIESRVEEIVTLVYGYLKPLQAEYLTKPGQTFETVYLTGGCGAMPSMGACVAKFFQLPTTTVTPEGLSAEYVHPANTVCYGILKHGARITENEPVGGHSAWNTLVHKAKKLLKFDRY